VKITVDDAIIGNECAKKFNFVTYAYRIRIVTLTILKSNL